MLAENTTLGSDTKDSSLLTERAVARVSAFVPVPEPLFPQSDTWKVRRLSKSTMGHTEKSNPRFREPESYNGQ